MKALKLILGSLIVVLTILVLTGAGGLSLTENQDVLRDRFEGAHGRLQRTVSISSHGQRMMVFGNIRVEDGKVAWQLLDPQGDVRAAGTVTGRSQDLRVNLDAQPGEWQLLLDCSQASGRYELGWEVLALTSD